LSFDSRSHASCWNFAIYMTHKCVLFHRFWIFTFAILFQSLSLNVVENYFINASRLNNSLEFYFINGANQKRITLDKRVLTNCTWIVSFGCWERCRPRKSLTCRRNPQNFDFFPSNFSSIQIQMITGQDIRQGNIEKFL